MPLTTLPESWVTPLASVSNPVHVTHAMDMLQVKMISGQNDFNLG